MKTPTPHNESCSRSFSQREHVDSYDAWYYTPMAVRFTQALKPQVTVYDCMDELSHFLGAPPSLVQCERELFAKADLVFTGGLSLFEAKREQHVDVHAFPSSIDRTHFERALQADTQEPEDQAGIPPSTRGILWRGRRALRRRHC